MTVRRETNSWRYPLIMTGYLFAMAYAFAFVTYHRRACAGRLMLQQLIIAILVLLRCAATWLEFHADVATPAAAGCAGGARYRRDTGPMRIASDWRPRAAATAPRPASTRRRPALARGC